MYAIERLDMAKDPRFEHNNDRVQHEREIEDAITKWTSRHTFDEALRILEEAKVPAGPIYSVVDMLADAHFQARGLFEQVRLDEQDTVKLPTLAPKLTETPGSTKWIGPPLGAHNREILGGLLGFSEQKLDELAAEGII